MPIAESKKSYCSGVRRGWRRSLSSLVPLFLLAVLPLSAQRTNAVTWSAEAKGPVAPNAAGLLIVHAQIAPGFHVYSLSTPPGGPIKTKLTLTDSPAVSFIKVYQPKPERKFDPNFGIDVELISGEANFYIVPKLAANAPQGPLSAEIKLLYQACDDRICLPPVKKSLPVTFAVQSGAGNVAGPPADVVEVTPMKVAAAAVGLPPSSGGGRVAPPSAARSAASGESPVRFLLVAFGLGLAALFTPCVFPMIPITVSFFLQQTEGGTRSRSAVLQQAGLFCGGIVVLFTALGLGIKQIVGPFGVARLGANPWVNSLITLVFFGFALSLFGAFEITLPAGLVNRMDSRSRRGGVLGTLLMGLTFCLTSFACVGPFVGSLLAASVQASDWQPVLGMVSFSAGLAAPFFLLALFPSVLGRLPKAGGWMVRVKVVMGFLLLASMLKYFTNVDQVWHLGWLSRERFLAAWVVLFSMCGLYLLGFLRLEGIKRDEPLGIARMLTAAVLLAFAMSLIPGMFHGSLGELEGWIPQAEAATLASGGKAEPRLAWLTNQYDAALAKAKAENKLVLINFTGYACTNCHWMRANMFTKPAVDEQLSHLVLLELFTDGEDPVSQKNAEFEQKLFQTVAIPFYAIVDGDGTVIANFPGLTRDEAEFLAFLRKSPAQAAVLPAL